jgi:hypothetical protein
MSMTSVEWQAELLMGEGLLRLGRFREARAAFAAAGDLEGLKAVGREYLSPLAVRRLASSQGMSRLAAPLGAMLAEMLGAEAQREWIQGHLL